MSKVCTQMPDYDDIENERERMLDACLNDGFSKEEAESIADDWAHQEENDH